MAKKKKSQKIINQNSKVKKLKMGLPTDVVPSLTERIAYKICKDEFEDFIEDRSQELQTANQDLYLLGLQFEFVRKKDPITTVHLSYIEVYQVYFNTNLNGDPFLKFALYETPNNPFEISTLKSQYFHDIEMFHLIESDGGGFSHHDLSSGSSVLYDVDGYKHLDFYQDDIGYVYFTFDQIQHLPKFFKEIVISGAQIEFGKKLSHHEGEEGDGINYKKNCFTLKMEGVDAYLPSLNSGNPFATAGTDVVIGGPCPEGWYLFKWLLGQAWRIDNDVIKPERYRTLWNSWLKNINVYTALSKKKGNISKIKPKK